MEKFIIDSINSLSGRYTPYQVFTDWITMFAIAIYNSCKSICNIGVNDGQIRHISEECKKRKVKQYDWWKIPELVGEGHIDKSVIEHIMRKLGKKANVENTHPHRFRRTGATLALRRGMPIEKVSKLLGHESIETTQIYLDISEKELEQAHRKFV